MLIHCLPFPTPVVWAALYLPTEGSPPPFGASMFSQRSPIIPIASRSRSIDLPMHISLSRSIPLGKRVRLHASSLSPAALPGDAAVQMRVLRRGRCRVPSLRSTSCGSRLDRATRRVTWTSAKRQAGPSPGLLPWRLGLRWGVFAAGRAANQAEIACGAVTGEFWQRSDEHPTSPGAHLHSSIDLAPIPQPGFDI